MSNTPYPPFPPNQTVVTKIGGFNRTCLVIDLCTIDPLTPAQLAQIEDKISLVLARETSWRSDVVGPNRFIGPLRDALRLE